MSFTLDDATKSTEWESLDLGVMTMLKALEHTTNALCEVAVPSGRVFALSCFLFSASFIFFCFLTTISLQSLMARSWGKSQFLHWQKEALDHLIEEARLHGEVMA